ncbi:FxsA family protein [Frigidibacter sp. ROC022]|uniref:FxsA family protein n=1 Tax=Frigidibacter sp. ROC022 TaxID=2971796 RepID=UPI00215B337F|nr:FxsA family protein [Frigidibacter sp. ROC022]MCR8724479.1 FxsA family protein [Frigidibacter sp. ROC022]
MWLFLALVLVPVIEIALFIQVGGAIGLWPTLLIVVLTALLGSQLIRRQGVGAFLALRSSVSELRDPTGALFDGAMILFSGALLLTPGFLTDATGLILLIPPVRAAIYAAIRKRIEVVAFRSGPAGPRPDGPGDVIDAEFERLDDDPTPGTDPRH